MPRLGVLPEQKDAQTQNIGVLGTYPLQQKVVLLGCILDLNIAMGHQPLTSFI